MYWDGEAGRAYIRRPAAHGLPLPGPVLSTRPLGQKTRPEAQTRGKKPGTCPRVVPVQEAAETNAVMTDGTGTGTGG